MKRFIFQAFPAFESRNFRLWFIGQLVSLSGTWMQNVALGWLVLTLTNSAFWVGLIAAITTFPALLFSLFGGVIADRFPKKNILLITKSFEMILAFGLGALTLTGRVQIEHIVVFAFLFGLNLAIDAPARQAFSSEMVEKKALSSAIALNAGVFNSARVIGPSLGGFVIAYMGIGGAFIVNGLTYLGAIGGLLLMKFSEKIIRKDTHPLQQIKEGLVYSFTNPSIRTLLFFVSIASMFGWSHLTILPVVARDILHLDASGLGFLYAASGFGSVAALVTVSALSRKVHPLVFIIGGSTIFGISLILFTFTTNIYLSYIWLFFSGAGVLALLAMLNATIQHQVKDSIRGRVMSVYVLMLIGLLPIGNFQIGYFAQVFGPWVALRICGIVVLLYGFQMIFRHMKLPVVRFDIGAQSQSRTDI